jgi:hypothetical protein
VKIDVFLCSSHKAPCRSDGHHSVCEEVRNRLEDLEAVAKAARRVLKERTVGTSASYAAANSSRCVCGCDADVEALRVALRALDPVASRDEGEGTP